MRRILVTGANRGLGLEFVRQSLQAGDRVIAACRHPGQATALNNLVGEFPNRLHVLPLDVAVERSRAELVRELALVTDGLDVLINNAGVLPSGERFGQVDAQVLSAALDTNAVGPFALAQALAPMLEAGQQPRIANVSSQLGSIARTDAFRTPSYAISKAAQNMATVLLARALAPRGVLAMALHPGWVRTDMGGKDGELEPADSVRGLLAVIHALRPEQSGQFLDYRGQVLPW